MIVYAGGSFDLFHRGHVELLRRASKYGRVVAAVNSDAFHQFYRGRPPIVGERDRLAVVMACRYVSHAFVMPEAEKQPSCILAWKADFIAHGDDWTGDSLLTQLHIDRAFLERHNISMLYLPYTTGISSSGMRAKL